MGKGITVLHPPPVVGGAHHPRVWWTAATVHRAPRGLRVGVVPASPVTQRPVREGGAVLAEPLVVARAQAERDVRGVASLDRAAVVGGPSVAGPLRADVDNGLDGRQVGGVYTSTVPAGRPTRAGAGNVAAVVDDKSVVDGAVFQDVGVSVGGEFVPGAVAVDGDGSPPRPAAVRAGGLVNEVPKVDDVVSGGGEPAAHHHQRVAVPLPTGVVGAAHSAADGAFPTRAAVFDNSAGFVFPGAGSVPEGRAGALPANIVFVAPAAGDGRTGAAGPVLKNAACSVRQGRTPFRQGFGRGRRWSQHRRPAHVSGVM